MPKSELQSIFEEIFEKVGHDGKFQKRFSILFNFVFLMFVCLPNLNLIIAMSVPQHWCHVPGRELTNLTEEQWKNLTIPRKNESGNMEFNSCKMFKMDNNLSTANSIITEYSVEETVDCQYGWEYDKTWYTSTIPSQENWVCNRELTVTNTFAFAKLGDIIGSFLFGQLGDILGRTFTYYVSILVLIIGRILLIFTPPYTGLFMLSVFIAGLSSTAAFQTPLVIGMEITKEERHAKLTMMQCVGWTIAFCLLPMIMWILKEWIPFILITSLPCGLFLFMRKYLIESPRWLASRGKKGRCLKELKKVARVNQKIITDDLALLVDEACLKIEVSYGIISIFAHWRLAKNTFLLICATIIPNMMFFIVTLSIGDMHGNPHINFFLQGIAELPAYFLGQVLCNKVGRRLTNALGCFGMSFGSLVLIFTINNASSVIYSLISAILIKFCLSLSFYTVNLTAVEIFPTSVRQTGFAICGITAHAFAAIGPYILYLKTYHASYPYIVSATICFVGSFIALLLPETLNEKLPDTLADAYTFGKKQPYFYIPKKATHNVIEICDN